LFINVEQIISECNTSKICNCYLIFDPDAEGLYLKERALKTGAVYPDATKISEPEEFIRSIEENLKATVVVNS